MSWEDINLRWVARAKVNLSHVFSYMFKSSREVYIIIVQRSITLYMDAEDNFQFN